MVIWISSGPIFYANLSLVAVSWAESDQLRKTPVPRFGQEETIRSFGFLVNLQR